MRQFGLVHLVHQPLHLVWPHRHTAQHTKFQDGTHKKHTQSGRKEHDTPPACECDVAHVDRTVSECWGYPSAETAGGAREARTARSDTGCSSHRNASRRSTVITTAGS